MNNSKKRSRLWYITITAVVAALVLSLAYAAAASIKPSKEEITLKDGEKTVTFDITLESDQDFAGAEFGLKPSSSDVKFESMEYSSALKNEANVNTEKNGIYYFGFFAGSNKFKAGKYQVATLKYTYSGDSSQTIRLDSSKIVRIKDDGTTEADTSSDAFTVTIKRVKTEEDPELANLKADLEKAQAEIDRLKKDLNDTTAKLDKSIIDLNAAEKKTAELQDQIDTLTKEKQELQTQVKELQEAKALVDKQLSDLKNGSTDPDALIAAKKDLEKANAAKEEAQRNVEYLKGKLDESTKMLDKLLNDKISTDKELVKAQEELERLNAKIAKMQKGWVSAPAKVKGLKANAGKKKVSLSWKKVKGASGYKVYKASGKNKKYSLAKTTGKTAVSVKNLKNGKTYYFKVKAYKKVSGGEVTGNFSNAAKAKVK